MKRILTLIFILPLFVFAQTTQPPSKEILVKAYSGVIAEYIKSTVKNDKLNFDILYIGKHEDFPEIQLPARIENKKIILLTYKEGDKTPQNNNSFILINIIENKFTKEYTEFLIITFHKDYKPQHNCFLELKFDPIKKEYALNRQIRYEYSYPKTK